MGITITGKRNLFGCGWSWTTPNVGKYSLDRPFIAITIEQTMLNAIVQFIRNFLCCIKDTSYGHNESHILFSLYNSTLTNQWIMTLFNIQLMEPLNLTTPLEVFISIAQFYVVCTGVPDAISGYIQSSKQMNRIYRLIQSRESTVVKSHAERLIHASLIQEAKMAIRSMIVAFSCFFISAAFIWLSANSWHITQTDWIGGLPALIQALLVMNICLMPLLYYMFTDSRDYFAKAKRIRLFCSKLQACSVTDADVGLTALQALTESGWTPFWSNRYSGTHSKYKSLDEDVQLLAAEIVAVQIMIDNMTGTSAIQKKVDDADAVQVLRAQIQQNVAAEMQPMIAVHRRCAYREIVYLILNTVAWYGYGMCIVVYYFPKVLQQPDWLRLILFHLENEDSDWYGNFAGDLMWTIEPVIILLSPMLMRPRRTKQAAKAKTE
jgi:hypothetical protein